MVNYNCYKNPIQIDIEKDLIRLRKNRKNQSKMQLIEEKNLTNIKKIENDENDKSYRFISYNLDTIDDIELSRYRGDGIFIDAMVNFDFSINGKSSVMKDELEYFNQKDCEIIMKLRTEYINLNHYLHHINYHVDENVKIVEWRKQYHIF